MKQHLKSEEVPSPTLSVTVKLITEICQKTSLLFLPQKYVHMNEHTCRDMFLIA